MPTTGLLRPEPSVEQRPNVRTFRSALPLVALVVLASAAHAQRLKPLTEARSESRQFVLAVESTSPRSESAMGGASEAASSQPASNATSESADREVPNDANAQPTVRGFTDGVWATMRRSQRGHADATVWRAQLINKLAPVQAFISDDGNFTITLDDYPVGGARHAVVIYNDKGELLREFSLRELLRKDDWKEVRERRGTIYWLRGAKMKFSRDMNEFHIDLRSDRKVVIDLRKLEIEGGAADAADIPPEFAAILDHPPQSDTDTPQSLDDAIDHLRKVIAANGQGATQEDIDEAHAIVESLLSRMSAQSWPDQELLQRVMEALGSAEIAAHPPTSDSDADTDGIEASPPETAIATPYAGNSAVTGIGVPQPNPSERVDYIGWMHDHTAVEGVSAAPLIAESVAGLTKWEGDSDLRDRALKGDPVALQSPEIQAWIAANQRSIELARQASGLPYRGVQPQEGAESLIGVLLPDLGARREISRAAVVRGRSLAAGGDLAGARREYIDAMRFGAQTGQGVTLIENLVGAAMQQPSANALLDSFERDDATDYAALAGELEAAYRPLRPTSELMQFERAAILETLQKTYEPDLERGGYKVGGEGLRTLAEIGSMTGKSEGLDEQLFMAQRLTDLGYENVLAQTNSFYDRFTASSRLPYTEARQDLEQVESEISDPALAQQNPFVATLMPALSRAMQSTGRAESQRRATLLVANLKAYKQQHGTYPPSLDVFAGREWATDPLTGQAFSYAPTDGNFRLYSVGVNGTDEGGTHDTAGRENDTVFWPRPK